MCSQIPNKKIVNEQAPSGKIFKCRMCGKISRWKYGYDKYMREYNDKGEPYNLRGWNELCAMHSDLVDESENGESIQIAKYTPEK